LGSLCYLEFSLLIVMKKTYIIFALMLLSFSLVVTSCEKEITLDLNQEAPRLVFEGWITSGAGPYEIKVTRTANVFSNDNYGQVTGANIIVTDDAGNIDTLVETSPGHYFTTTLQGQVGRTYTMTAVVDDETFVASCIMPRVNAIEGMFAFEQDSTYTFGAGTYVLSVATEPSGLGDYYLFRFYRNDTLYDDASDYLLFEDRFVDGQQVPFPWPYQVETGDTAVAEIRSITKDAYEFYYTFVQSQFGSGGPFGAPADNLLGNVSNDGLGFFGAYGLARDTLIIP
jgi:Domain of unknown function (DUF4249)